ncbi:hypothetical protein FQZ97_794220 [compost metagenome]
MAVPVDPENADRAVVDGKLRQAQRVPGRFAQFDFMPCGEQTKLQGIALPTQQEQQRQTDQQQHAE